MYPLTIAALCVCVSVNRMGYIYIKSLPPPGLPVALYNVGGHYFAGKGVELSFKKAADYYQQAADMGFAPAQVIPHSSCHIYHVYTIRR